MAFEGSADKIEEANHFLLLMRVAELPSEDGAVPARLQGETAFRYAFSAFVSAARAILHLVPEEGVGVPGFTRWYVTARERWLRGELATFFADRAEFRLIFPGGMADVSMVPPAVSSARAVPAAEMELPDVETIGHGGAVRFAERPRDSATELCARYLAELAIVVSQARKLAG
ncbi:MAG TPA: hypothetical protein VFS62_11910 [Chloroflexota bacterium]|nr:hypothetical protein [Chloroflexota bacterium]